MTEELESIEHYRALFEDAEAFYGDGTTVVVTLSQGRRAAAVVRDNIQAHVRFAAAHDGQLVFDDDDQEPAEDDVTTVAVRPFAYGEELTED